MKELFKKLGKVIAAAILGLTVLTAHALYANWRADRQARAFCDAIPIGSNISDANVRARDQQISSGPGRFYTFYFPASFFDTAVCEVERDEAGKVLRKGSVMRYD